MKRLFIVALAGSVAGCSFLAQHDRRIEDKTAQPAPSLELPPELSATIDDELKIPANKTSYADYNRQDKKPAATTQQTASHVLPASLNISVLRNGDKRWLEIVDQQPDQLWQKVHQFWVNSGFTLKKEDPKIGIMETEWNENRDDIPQDIIRKTLGSVLDFLWQSSTKDKFLTRLERTDRGTEIFLTHRGVEEISQDDGETTATWQARPSDPEREAEMLQRLMVYLGDTPEQAKTTLANVVSSGVPRAGLNEGLLLINEEFPLAWRSIGLAIDKSGMSIEDRNRTTGFYYVKVAPKPEKKGWFASLLDNNEEVTLQELQIRISEIIPTQCQVEILDKNGKPSSISSQINHRLLEHLK